MVLAHPLQQRADAQEVRPPVPNDRRRRRRVAVSFPASLKLTYPAESEQSFRSEITDVSDHGMRLVTAERLYPGSILMIRVMHATLWAEVRHCCPSPAGFQVGVSHQDCFVRPVSGPPAAEA